MLAKPAAGNVSNGSALKKNTKDSNQQEQSQNATSIEQLAAEPTTVELLLQNKSELDALKESDAGNPHDNPDRAANSSTFVTPSEFSEQSVDLFQTALALTNAGNIAFRSATTATTLEANTPTDAASKETELLGRLVTAIEDARGGSAQSEQNLIEVMQEVVVALRELGIHPGVSATDDGLIYMDSRAGDLPSGVHYDQVLSGGRGKNDHTHPDDYVVRVYIGNYNDQQLLSTASQLSQLLHTQVSPADGSLVSIESQLADGVSTDADRNNLLVLVEQLDQQQVAQGHNATTQRIDGDLVISESLLAGISPDSTSAQTDSNNQNWYSADSLDLPTLVHAAEQLRDQAALEQLGQTATFDQELRTQALNAVIDNLSEADRNALLDSSVNLQRELQLVNIGEGSRADLVEAITSMDRLLNAHGISGIYNINERGQVFLRGVAPPTFGPNEQVIQGHPGHWADLTSGRVPIPLQSIAQDLLDAPMWQAGMHDVEQFGVFAGENPIHVGRLRDDLSPDSVTVNPDDPTLAESVANVASLAGANSAGELKSLARSNFVTASHLLTQSAYGLKRDDMIAAYGLVNAERLEDFGFQQSVRINVGGKTSYDEDQGPYGGLSRESFQFAQAWLNTSREQRLEHLGLDAEKWNTAESYIGQGIEAQRAADKAEFGFDDAAIIAAAVGISIAAGGVTSAFVSAALPGAAVGTTAATTTNLLLSGAAGAFAGSFSSTLVLTGDIENALKSGALAAITGGFGQYAQSIGGGPGLVAEAITSGIASELTGGDFTDGVLNAVGQSFGEGVRSFVGENFHEFIAGFAGKVTEAAIITRGDPDAMEELLINYVQDFASGEVQSFLNNTVGPHSRTASLALGGLADTVIQSGGDINAIEEYIESGDFLDSLAPSLGAEITEAFGGEDSLKAALLGDITQIILASNGDPEKIQESIGLLALSFAGKWAGGQFNDHANALLGTDENPLVGAVSTLLEVGIASGWDSSIMTATAFGPVLDSLTDSALELLPDSVGGPEGFVAGALDTLVTSFAANNGDTEAVARDLATYIGTELGEAVLASSLSGSEITANSSGERIAGVQQSLIEQGYLPNGTMLGEFDQATVTAINNFQGDQLSALSLFEGQLPGDLPDVIADAPVAQQIAELRDEQNRGVVGEITAKLLESPLMVFEVPASSRDVVSDEELLNNIAEYQITFDTELQAEIANLERVIANFDEQIESTEYDHVRFLFVQQREPFINNLRYLEEIANDPNAAIVSLLAATESRNESSSLSEVGHFGLDMIGLLPGLGEAADALNAVWYASEGRTLDAALSSMGMVPFGGIAATIGRWTSRAPGGLQRFNPNDTPLTSAQIHDIFEPADGKFDNFEHYRFLVRNNWRPLSNHTYELEGIIFRTDDLGRTTSVSGSVDPGRNVGRIGDIDTNLGQQAGSVNGDVGFHLGADQLGFPGGPLNVLPGNGILNNGDYAELEKTIRGLHDSGVDVQVLFQPVYNLGNVSPRPDSFIVRYREEGGRWITPPPFLNN